MVENNDKLSGVYKELWIQYQNDETKEISELSYDELVERIIKWESVEFEARAKRQKDIAEKRVRDNKRLKDSRDGLITDPHYSPKDSPTKTQEPYKIKGERLSKEDKLKNSLGDLGINLGDLLGEIKSKKLEGVKELREGMSDKKE